MHVNQKPARNRSEVVYGIVAATAALTAIAAAITALSVLSQPAAPIALPLAASLTGVLAALLSSLSWFARRMHAQLRTGLAEFEALRSRTSALAARHKEELAVISTRLASAEQMNEEMAHALAQTKRALAETEKALKTRASGEALVSATARIAKLEPWLARVSNVLNTRASGEAVSALGGRIKRLEYAGKSFHVHSRMLSEADIDELLDKWVIPLGLEQTKSGVRYLAERFTNIERLCVGRLATDIQTLLARALTALAIKQRNIHIVEIGVLFGVASGAIYDACRFKFDSAYLTLIDPLQGYYDRSSADIITQVSVNRRALDHNLAAMDVSPSDFTIIQHFSESPEALAAIDGKAIDLLVIDGDHSYAGVKRDFENYRDFVRVGGFILFDDYDTGDWPEIREYVDKEVRPDKGMELVAAGFRTALFRKTGDIAVA